MTRSTRHVQMISLLVSVALSPAVGCDGGEWGAQDDDDVGSAQLASTHTPPGNPDSDPTATECLDGEGAGDLRNPGRIHNRFLWCMKQPTWPVSFTLNTPDGPILESEINIGWKAVGYGRDDGQRGMTIFFKPTAVDVIVPGESISMATPLVVQIVCPQAAEAGCGVSAPVERTFLQWKTMAAEGVWTSFSLTSNPAFMLPDRVSFHKWFLEFKVPGLEPPLEPSAPIGLSVRCDSATYFRGRPAACVFWDVVPHLQYSLADPKVADLALHIKCAQDPSFDPGRCGINYPITPFAKFLPGTYTGSRVTLGLNRIPSEGQVLTDTRAAENRDEAVRACSRVGRYANPGNGSGFPGLPASEYPQTGFDCDEYPMSSTLEGAAKNGSSTGARGVPEFSVKSILRGPNRCGGNRLKIFYADDRILYEHFPLTQDAFYVQILDVPRDGPECELEPIDGGEIPSGGSGGGGPIPGVLPTVSAGLDVSGAEGEQVLLSGNVSGAAVMRWTYEPGPDVDPGTTCSFAGSNQPVTTFRCTDDGTFTVTLTASNDAGEVSSSAVVHVLNRPPLLSLLAPAPWQVFRAGDSVTISAPFVDLGSNDTHSCLVEWDDGIKETNAAMAGTCDRLHVFLHAGMYTMNVTVSDDDGGSQTRSVMVVVCDPDAGFVTAGGFIDSPEGALSTDPTVVGKGHFQFNPKYHKGDPGPAPSGGKAQFRLDGSGFDVDSTTLEWLVVTADGKAAVKGTATVAGQPGYGFVIYAHDAADDKYRLVVWKLADSPFPLDSILYDSHRGRRFDVDVAEPQPLSGGSINIHQ